MRTVIFLLLFASLASGSDRCRVFRMLGAKQKSPLAAWSVEAGNLQLHPEDLLAPEWLRETRKAGPLKVTIQKVPMTAHPGIPPGMWGERVILRAGEEELLRFTLGNDPKEPGVFHLSDLELKLPHLNEREDLPSQELLALDFLLRRLDETVRWGGGHELRVSGAQNVAVWKALRDGFGFVPASPETAKMLATFEKEGRETFPEDYRFEDESSLDNAVGDSANEIPAQARAAFAQYRANGTLPQGIAILRDTQGKEVIIAMEDSSWYLIHPDPARGLVDWATLYREGGLVLSRPIGLPRSALTAASAVALAKSVDERRANPPGDSSIFNDEGRLLPRDPQILHAWRIREGNIGLSPEMLLPTRYLEKLGEREQEVAVKATKVMVSNPVVGFPKTGIDGHEVSLTSEGKLVVKFSFAADPKDAKAVFVEGLSIQEPLEDGRTPGDVFPKTVTAIENAMRAAGMKKIRSTGPGSFSAHLLLRAQGYTFSHPQTPQLMQDLRAAYSVVRKGHPDGPAPLTAEQFSNALGLRGDPGPDETSQALWQAIRKGKAVPPNVQILRDDEGEPVMLVERRPGGKVYSIINRRAKDQRLFDWNELYQQGLLYIEKPL